MRYAALQHEIVVVLHNVRSIQNVASIFRTCDGAGVATVYLSGYTPAPIDKFRRPIQQFTKVSLGAEGYVAWEKIASTGPLISKLKKRGFYVMALEQDKRAVQFDRFSLNKRVKKVALVVGNEVRGVPKTLIKRCDAVIDIPMRGWKESLNVSVAFGIAIYSLTGHGQPEN